MNNGHNSDDRLDQLGATVEERFNAAKGASKTSLNDFRAVGDALNEAKELFAGTKGAFGNWCADFPFDKTWRARLMKLAANWDAIMEAMEAIPQDKRKWSVDGCLTQWQAVIRAKAKAAAGEGSGDGGAGGAGNGEGGSAGSAGTEKKETPEQKLRRELREAKAQIKALERELKKAQAAADKASKAKADTSSKAKADAKPNPDAKQPTAATKARARKVWALYQKPGTQGEGAAAYEKFAGMAQKHNMTVDQFAAACGLN